MINILFDHIQQKVPLTDQDKHGIKPFFTAKRLRKRQYLLQSGDVCKHLAFVTKGLLRTYNVDDKGDEHMSVFGWEGWWISDFNSFLTGQPALFNIDAIENSELMLISHADYEALTIAVPVMDRYFRILYQNSLVTKERRLMSSITHSAEERYLELAGSTPKMIERIPQNLVASYLGIAPETLSRIKKNLTTRK
ncbi:Crp/Fnr family transcriptional regulator [Mucilaginibacter myungsuensis]|uniref:Crp/Fnr family transcriptional regulator n=1 Tax=Mucilaginibacter myungsuensis TaxID=649104 RepID=A0A929PXJ4_9SPHI|nr:Crp/Fnr family transcriptional regulator [Mucilaginibacter myungsuensis]MBE9662465.1 Crp/Fnr family transcriptional regulator [Mucilaginibacter myungsuensis]MDN3597885.1 Crp/Fnr family transcriptional regulator [Mucilaginibacter myungsuensis]